MNRLLHARLWMACVLLFYSVAFNANAQTTVTTGLPSSAGSGSGAQYYLTFVVENTNSFAIVITDIEMYRATGSNGNTFTLFYNPTTLSGPPALPTGWTSITSVVLSTISTTAIHPTFTNLSFTIPANTTYRFAVQTSGTALNYGGSTATPNNFTNGGVKIGNGNYQINGLNVGYWGPSTNPRFWCGSITFIPAAPCTSPPTAGTATVNNAMPCGGSNIILGLSGNSGGLGQTYQWEESFTPGGPFSPIAGATNAVATVQANATMYYRAAVTCNSITSYSTEVLATVPTPFPGGTYTINSAQPTGGGNFQSFTDAVAAISCGISGPIVFNVAPGSGPYNEQINIPATVGSNATNTVTFNGNGCTITQNLTAAGTNYATINLDGADYITFDNLNIEALGVTYGFGVHLMNSADNNTFNNCNITANTSATATTTACVSMSGSASIYSTAGSNGMNNTFDSCTLTGGYFGFVFYGSAQAGNTNNNITNCTVKDYYVYGSYNYYQGYAMISNNIFERPTRTTVSTFYGVFLTTGCTNMLVEKNTIRNAFTGAPTSTSAGYALYCAADATPGNENKFVNNLVHTLEGNGTHAGLYLTGADYVQAYHNTISLDYTAATAGTTYGIYSTGTVGGIDIKNNIVAITRGGSGTKYCLYYTVGLQSSNNNDLYINSAAGSNNVGYYSVAFATVAAWKTANNGIWDQSSVDADPIFSAPATGNYLFTNLSMDNLATPVGVATDIMNNPRDPVVPDMGAYEVPNAPCTTPPTAGTASANPNTAICGGANIFLNLTGITSGSGQTYQWEESFTPGGPFSPATAVLQSPGTNITATTSKYYRAAVTCGTSTSYSTEVFVNVGAIAGTASIPSATICYGGTAGLSLAGHTGNNIQWEAYDSGTSSWIPIAGATTASYNVTNLQAATDFRAAISCNTPAGTVYSNTLSVSVINPQIVETFPGARCNAGPVTLAALPPAGHTVKWYDAITAGNLLGTGNAYTTPSISTTTNYYAAAVSGGGGSGTVPLPAHGSNYTGNVRGMWFTAPVSFTITGLQAMAQTTGAQSIAVVRFTAPPPIFSATTNAFTVLYLTQNNPATGVIPVNIQVNVGDVIGVLSQVGTSSSYATPTGPFVTTIAGQSVTLTRMGMQFPLTTTAPQDLWEETGGAIGRTEITYQIGCEGPRIAVPATINGAASGTGLSTGGTTIINNHAISTAIDYMDACNDRVATITNNPAALGNTAATVITSPTVKTFGGKPYVPRVFDIAPTTNGSATVTLYALQSDFNAYNSYVTSNSLSLPLLPATPTDPNISNIRITQFHGNALAGTTGPLGLYDSQNASFITNVTTTWTGQYWAMTFPVTGFSGFFIHTGATPLVIDLKDISAVNVGNRNRIDWRTASEHKGDLFELERSADGENFAKLANISAKGEAGTYSYWDENPISGINYYRLKLVNTSGNTSYSKVVSATVKGAGVFTVEAYPNPVSDLLIVKVSGAAGNNATVMITDVTGKMVKMANVSDNKAEINMSGLAQGVYLVKYADSKQSQTIKVNKD